MGSFTARRKSPVEKLQRKLELNPVWPFERRKDGTLVYSVWYSRFIVGVFGLVASCGMGVFLYVLESVGTNFFLWCVTGLVLSVFAIFNYKDRRLYVIDTKRRHYKFKLGAHTIIHGNLHDIYVRLRTRIDSGTTYHYLIFCGYRIDKIFLSSACGDEGLAGLRELGKEIAENLGINYFDNKNISGRHVVRNFPPTHPDYASPELSEDASSFSKLLSE
jgi:hypothetical protein